jgi:histidinol dehydrogenase
MIRRLVVPPLEALRPFLPQLNASIRRPGRPSPAFSSVATDGDRAVRASTVELDGLDLTPETWEVPRSQWVAALARLPLPLRQALELAVARVTAYHERQRDPGFTFSEADGTVLGMKVTALDRVGLYVPGGKASYPSSVIMNAIPAVVAGVRDIIAVTPPGGFLTDAVLAACELAGVTRLFRIGGAQAVAALAYGTATVPRVDKIVGPGSRWVAEAKRQVVGQVGIDSIAGPTEVLVLADDSAGAARVACDLIARRNTTRTLRPGASPPRRTGGRCRWPSTALSGAARGHRPASLERNG